MGEAEQIVLIPLDKLTPHPQNPRRDMGDLSELAASIREIGVIEPIAVVERDGQYLAVTGSRRAAASRVAGAKTIPARVMSMDEQQAAAAALIENLQRKDLTPLEEAEAYRSYLTLTGGTQAELAKKIGRGASTIANALRLLEAPKPVKDALAAGTITAAHARVALELKDPGLATSLHFKPDEPVRDLKAEVDQANRKWSTTGGGAAAAAHAFLAKAQKDHPGVTIVWRPQPSYDLTREVDLMKALGKPPKSWRGLFRHKGDGYMGRPTPEQHDKVCECKALELTVDVDYQTFSRMVFSLRRCCVVESAYKKATPKGKKPSRSKASGESSKPKELTPAQQAKLQREREAKIRKRIAEALTPHKPRKSEWAPLFAKLSKVPMQADAARAYIASEVLPYRIGGEDEAMPLAWTEIVKMPADRLLALAGSLIAERLTDELQADELAPILAHFHLAVPAPKAKKPAKRKAA